MATDVLITLATVLLKVDELPWEYALYIPEEGAAWAEDMNCMVLDPEETEDPDDDPNVAKENSLKYALTISDVQDIVENVNAQKKSIDQKTVIDAIRYYYDKGAFITLN